MFQDSFKALLSKPTLDLALLEGTWFLRVCQVHPLGLSCSPQACVHREMDHPGAAVNGGALFEMLHSHRLAFTAAECALTCGDLLASIGEGSQSRPGAAADRAPWLRRLFLQKLVRSVAG